MNICTSVLKRIEIVKVLQSFVSTFLLRIISSNSGHYFVMTISTSTQSYFIIPQLQSENYDFVQYMSRHQTKTIGTHTKA